LTCAFAGSTALHKPATTRQEMENTVFKGLHSI
jgi:hypothetical protein